jgi:hypothetical protein
MEAEVRIERTMEQRIGFIGFGFAMLVFAILQAISTYHRDQRTAQVNRRIEQLQIDLDMLKAKSEEVKRSMNAMQRK